MKNHLRLTLNTEYINGTLELNGVKKTIPPTLALPEALHFTDGEQIKNSFDPLISLISEVQFGTIPGVTVDYFVLYSRGWTIKLSWDDGINSIKFDNMINIVNKMVENL